MGEGVQIGLLGTIDYIFYPS